MQSLQGGLGACRSRIRARMEGKPEALLLYAITQKKMAFLKLINEEVELFYDLPNVSMLLKEDIYREYLNLNSLNRKNLKESADLTMKDYRLKLLAKREHTFDELKLLCTAEEAVIRLYEQLTCKRSDERIAVLRELIKRECVPDTFEEEQIEPLARALSGKPLSRWIREDFQNIPDLSYGTALWLLVYREQLKGMEKEITMEQQAIYLLKDLALDKRVRFVNGIKRKADFRGCFLEDVKRKTSNFRRISTKKCRSDRNLSICRWG